MRRTTSNPGREPKSRCALPPPLEALRLLGRADLPHDTFDLARALIGKVLARDLDGTVLAARIVETEAYLEDDPASHAFRGRTARNAAMFGPPLHAYVYFIYGANWCLNVTSEAPGRGAAVLIRAAEPLAGVPEMRAARARPDVKDRDLLRGPGNLCRALVIDRRLDGVDLVAPGGPLSLADDGTAFEVGVSARIGITKAAAKPWRFYARGNASVSGPRALSP